ncbi:hypothetical protein KIL84_018564 [Mauremys mutica]|uniref:Ig-like domain-containing protein n=1 Tax=Mauremys mutica TaxID=74926 RepID=A0A9D3XV86_9SAUR|nr:hypothetical protein KIL84_018564 [Mauremys mutica]
MDHEVLQVTWQKESGEGKGNIATYSRINGHRILGNYSSRVNFTQSELTVSAITVHAVTLQDEGCYKCIFNTFPLGSITGRTCLKVYAISEPSLEAKLVSSPENGEEKVLEISCSVTGKPAPMISWNLSHRLQEEPGQYLINHSDQTVTVISNFTHVPSRIHWENPAVCVIQHPLLNVTLTLSKDGQVQGANEAVRCERVPAATLGEDVTLKCNFIPSFNVIQVTWQKLEGSSFKNIATYSKAHGTESIGPFNKRVCFNDTSLKASSITFRGVTLEDETCYKCIFNAFPHGSFGRETCLLQCANGAVRCERVPAAALGEDVTLKCNFIPSFDVLQVTWQKLEGSSFKNIATYSKAYGTKSIGPFNKRVCFNYTSLKESSITFRGVTLEDETCYKCIFNAFPHGSFSREICLIVHSISAVRTELHSNASSPELLTAVCSATAKPAPEITWKPEGVLIGQPEIHGVKNANGTVTMTSTCNISVRLLRSKNLQALTCVINHPMGKKEKIIDPLEEYKGRLDLGVGIG